MENIKILVADDHQLVIDGIKSLLEDTEGIVVVVVATNGKEAVAKLESKEVDIVLMDMDMPVMNGYDATGIISDKYPHIKVIALTMYNEKSLIQKMMDAGVSGYILKNIGKEELEQAIRIVNEGGEYYSSEIPITLSRPTPIEILSEKQQVTSFNQLTRREIEVLKLIAQGLSNSAIGEKLFISPRTVDTHRTNLMKKLEVHNIAGLIRLAIQNSLVE